MSKRQGFMQCNIRHTHSASFITATSACFHCWHWVASYSFRYFFFLTSVAFCCFPYHHQDASYSFGYSRLTSVTSYSLYYFPPISVTSRCLRYPQAVNYSFSFSRLMPFPFVTLPQKGKSNIYICKFNGLILKTHARLNSLMNSIPVSPDLLCCHV